MDGHPRRPLSAEPYFNSCQRQTVSSLWPGSEDFTRASNQRSEKVYWVRNAEERDRGGEVVVGGDTELHFYCECLKSPHGHGVLTEDWHTVMRSIQLYTLFISSPWFISTSSWHPEEVRALLPLIRHQDLKTRPDSRRDMTGLWDRRGEIWQPFFH